MYMSSVGGGSFGHPASFFVFWVRVVQYRCITTCGIRRACRDWVNYDKSASEILVVRTSSGRPDIDMVVGSDLDYLRVRKRTAPAA